MVVSRFTTRVKQLRFNAQNIYLFGPMIMLFHTLAIAWYNSGQARECSYVQSHSLTEYGCVAIQWG